MSLPGRGRRRLADNIKCDNSVEVRLADNTS